MSSLLLRTLVPWRLTDSLGCLQSLAQDRARDRRRRGLLEVWLRQKGSGMSHLRWIITDLGFQSSAWTFWRHFVPLAGPSPLFWIQSL